MFLKLESKCEAGALSLSRIEFYGAIELLNDEFRDHQAEPDSIDVHVLVVLHKSE